jgi:hypothetical protein
MDFKQIEELKKEDVVTELERRIFEKLPDMIGVVKPEDLDAELIMYKRELLEKAIPEELSKLIDNNSATIEAFPEAVDNHAKWVEVNIKNNKDIADAVAKVKAIKAKEIELFDRITAETQVRAKNEEIKIKFHAALVDLVKGSLADAGFKSEDIEEFKKCGY